MEAGKPLGKDLVLWDGIAIKRAWADSLLIVYSLFRRKALDKVL